MSVLKKINAPQKNRVSIGPTGLWLLSWILIFSSAATPLHAQRPVAKEFQVKAVFLYNFTQFVSWPPQSFDASDSPLIIGILGIDPFGAYIDQLVEGEAIGKHPLVIKRYKMIEDVGNTHILYINLKKKDEIRSALDSLESKPVLTVSDADHFARMGGMIRFIRDEDRIRIRINIEAVTDGQLVISSKLLRLSEIVSGTNK